MNLHTAHKFFGIWVVFVLAVNVGLLWLTASAITSGVKALSEDCGQTYGVESVVSGNWFCPVSEDE